MCTISSDLLPDPDEKLARLRELSEETAEDEDDPNAEPDIGERIPTAD